MTVNYDLQPVWRGILDIYQAIADVCNKHHLTYYVTGGNCLGAVRHQGFIPWDDDLDIFLPWSDYDRFWQVIKSELPEYWKGIGWWNCDGYGFMHGKVQECRRAVVDDIEKKSNLRLPDGIFVDVFPLVGLPNSFWGKVRWRISGFFLQSRRKYLFEGGRRVTFKRWVAAVIGFVSKVFYPDVIDLRSSLRAHERRARRYALDPNGFCGWYTPSTCTVSKPIPTYFFGSPAYLPFEGIQVPVPSDYHGYLRYKFGNYMQLPPEEKRVPAHRDSRGAFWKYGECDGRK